MRRGLASTIGSTRGARHNMPLQLTVGRRRPPAAERQSVRQTTRGATSKVDSGRPRLMERTFDMGELRSSQGRSQRSDFWQPLKEALLSMVIAAGGCSSAPKNSISASEFERGCSVDSDCVAVYEGTLRCCPVGACPNAAINQSRYAAYTSTAASRTPSCTNVPCLQLVVICRSAAVCASRTCMFENPAIDAASHD